MKLIFENQNELLDFLKLIIPDKDLTAQIMYDSIVEAKKNGLFKKSKLELSKKDYYNFIENASLRGDSGVIDTMMRYIAELEKANTT